MGDILLRLLNPTETVDDGNTMYDAAKEIEALRDTLASHTSALAERDARIVELEAENERLRHVVSDCAAALNTGAFVSPKATVGFMESLPKEIALTVSELRSGSLIREQADG